MTSPNSHWTTTKWNHQIASFQKLWKQVSLFRSFTQCETRKFYNTGGEIHVSTRTQPPSVRDTNAMARRHCNQLNPNDAHANVRKDLHTNELPRVAPKPTR